MNPEYLYEEDKRFWDLLSLAKQTRLPKGYLGSAPVRRLFVSFWRDRPFSFTRFLDPRQRRTTVSRTPLDEWSAPRRELYLTTHNTHNRQTSKPPMGFEPTISADERPQTLRLRPRGHWHRQDFFRIRKKGKTSPYLHLQFAFSFIYNQRLGFAHWREIELWLCVGFQSTIFGSFHTKANFFENSINKLNSFYLFAEEGKGVETNTRFQ